MWPAASGVPMPSSSIRPRSWSGRTCGCRVRHWLTHLAQHLVGAERDEERRGVEKHHRARRGGEAQALIDQHELDAEDACPTITPGPSEPSRSEKSDSSPPADDQQHRQRADRAEHRLHHRRNVRQRELHRDLVETPGQAQHQHQRDGARAERSPGGRTSLRFDGISSLGAGLTPCCLF